jgi:hypothetical protein
MRVQQVHRSGRRRLQVALRCSTTRKVLKPAAHIILGFSAAVKSCLLSVSSEHHSRLLFWDVAARCAYVCVGAFDYIFPSSPATVAAPWLATPASVGTVQLQGR